MKRWLVFALALMTAGAGLASVPGPSGARALAVEASPSAAHRTPRTEAKRDESSLPDTAVLVVSASGPFTTIEAALSAAQDGDTIEVRGGTHPGPLVVEKSVTLNGLGWPVVDGGGQGTVVTLAAPGAVFRGFEVRGSGVQPDQDHAGITLTAPGIVVEGNRLRDVLFGIFVAQAADSVVRGNDIGGKVGLDLARKGDGIRLWYSPRVTVAANHVHDSRDLVIWYSESVVVTDNLIEGGRYGVHLMYCNGARIERNRLESNSVGVYTMYSKGIVLKDNLIRGQRGPSGYALGFKDTEDVEAIHNALVDNYAGVFLDGTPFSPQGFARFDDNVLAFNDVGAIIMTANRGAAFEGNTFWENGEAVAVQGGGSTGENSWQGNYWSDYTGFDADGDGLGDMPYRSERLFENLTDREPLLRALSYSPAAQTIEFATSMFPVVRPRPKLTDPSPMMEPASVADWAGPPRQPGWKMALAGLGLLGLGLAGGAFALSKDGRSMMKSTAAAEDVRSAAIVRESPLLGGKAHPPKSAGAEWVAPADASLQITGVSKRYGRATALNEVSFEVRAGETLALWGSNGAGKTTLIKAILGLIEFDGRILVEGLDVRREGRGTRRLIGYVPQEAAFYDFSVQAAMEFYGRLKDGGRREKEGRRQSPFLNSQRPASDPRPLSDRISTLLDRLGLAEHAHKPVPALSGGLKQRLALAVALLSDPPVLLFDEPTANLDAAARRDYLALLSALRREKKTLVFASHRMEEVNALADRVLVLEQGRAAGMLTPEALRQEWNTELDLTLWVPELQRPRALACLTGEGLSAHLNGRGTVVVRVREDQKARPLTLLGTLGISVTDFEVGESG